MKTSLSKLWKTEDWLAVWIGFIIISAGIISVLTGSFDFSAAKFSTWHLWEDVAEKKSLLEQFNGAFILKLQGEKIKNISLHLQLFSSLP